MNPVLLSSEDSSLLIVDVQAKFLAAIPDHTNLIWNLERLAQGASILNVECLATEQYPEKLGPTIPALLPFVANRPVPAKLTFSCMGCEELVQQLRAIDRKQVVVAGIEAHVCVLQTALDLLSEGYDVFVVVDAIAARREIDTTTATRRMELAGVTLVTTESVLFEWCGRAGTPKFKEISKIVRSEP